MAELTCDSCEHVNEIMDIDESQFDSLTLFVKCVECGEISEHKVGVA